MKTYLPLKKRSHELGDAYYGCLTKALTSSAAPELDECLDAGKKYSVALREQLDDLGRFSDQQFVARESDLIRQYLALIELDLVSLSAHDIEPLKKRRPRTTNH